MTTRTPVDSGPHSPGNTPSPARAALARHPVTWFFTLAFTLSWLAWTPYILSRNGLGTWHFTFPGGSAGSQVLGVLPGAYLGPIGSALLVTWAAEGRAGLRAWRRRMTKFRVGWYWYLAVLVAVPAALVAATTVLSGTGPLMPPALVLAAYLPGLIGQMVTTGLAEEPGWREFAMPRVQRRYGPVRATLIVGLLWGAWHLPLFLTEWGGGPHVNPLKPVEFVVTALAFSYVMTYVFNRSGESMPLVMLLHTSVNNYFSMAWSDMFPSVSTETVGHAFLVASVVPALILLAVTRGRLGLRRAPLTA